MNIIADEGSSPEQLLDWLSAVALMKSLRSKRQQLVYIHIWHITNILFWTLYLTLRNSILDLYLEHESVLAEVGFGLSY